MIGPDGTITGSTKNGLRGRLDRALGRASEASLRTGNRLTLLPNGLEIFDEWLEQIGRAEKWIHLELFQFEGGRIGRRFAEAVTQRQGRASGCASSMIGWALSWCHAPSGAGCATRVWRCVSSTLRR